MAEKPNHVLFQMRKLGINLPGYLDLRFVDDAGRLLLTETITVGYAGFGKILNPLLRLSFSKSFFAAMDGHRKREWANLAKILR